ncbi:MBL fold metallo-hydrolase [Tunturiibacter empetritectus]|uniref:Glyoxylase-like metal-dependent hydrolase (Beta-lactamase superfamily II) n=2 Tax=Tunturiibacter TaxID=3154218 RepID=A0A852VKY4_9BACT|nr:MBL fold metallo-hydrolase [Edaphobacter lichenicola]NYF91919.1 glyoxylase-like metal-dependent hydrolase (beta-lactamase superfamily II) [Edaphobacter lichenicola]
MKTTPITANAHQLTRFGLINCYLVRETDGFTLIDANLANSADDILAAAKALGAPIRRILITHAHVDHVGSVDALLAKLGATQIEFTSNARSLPLLQKPPNKSPQPGEPNEEIRGGLPGIDARPTRLVTEGELYGSLLAIETPGHIPGHLAFLDQRDGTLYAGDALIAMGHLTVSGFAPWYFPLPNLATWDKSIALASANKLLTYPIERFACGHGSVRPGGIPTLRKAIASTAKS